MQNLDNIQIEDEDDVEAETGETFAREAAVVELGKLLLGKTYGDRITAAEIQEATGFQDWRSFRGRIKTWAKRNGFVASAVANDGYRFMMPKEHVDHGEHQRKKAFRAEKRGLQSVMVVIPKLEEESDVRRAEFYVRKAAVRVAAAKLDHEETRKEFKLTDRVPLRKLTSGK